MVAHTFTVSHANIRVKVRLLPTVMDVHREHQARCLRCRDGNNICAFFLPAQRVGRYVGTIVLPLAGKLHELVPHEVTHAVIHSLNGVLSHDDEACCTAVGRISARIFNHIGQIGGAL
jgi:hypothetical protein